MPLALPFLDNLGKVVEAIAVQHLIDGVTRDSRYAPFAVGQGPDRSRQIESTVHCLFRPASGVCGSVDPAHEVIERLNQSVQQMQVVGARPILGRGETERTSTDLQNANLAGHVGERSPYGHFRYLLARSW
jgi:hypothetical protein